MKVSSLSHLFSLSLSLSLLFQQSGKIWISIIEMPYSTIISHIRLHSVRYMYICYLEQRLENPSKSNLYQCSQYRPKLYVDAIISWKMSSHRYLLYNTFSINIHISNMISVDECLKIKHKKWIVNRFDKDFFSEVITFFRTWVGTVAAQPIWINETLGIFQQFIISNHWWANRDLCLVFLWCDPRIFIFNYDE